MIYVLAYPELPSRVSENIAVFRSSHEPDRARLVEPHITLVFGLRNIRDPDAVGFCEQTVSQLPGISIAFSNSRIDYDPFEEVHKLSLAISVGADRLIALHQSLYDGPHHSQLHPGIPYRPHMTVATNRNRSALEALDTAAIGAFPIAGRVSRLEVVKLAAGTLHTLAAFELQT